LPADLKLWGCTRIDVTHNYLLASSDEVFQALSVLRQSEGGRFQVKTSAETVYWGQGSALRTLKAYAKGPHLTKQFRKNEAQATLEEMQLAQRLLRLELSLKGQYWRERSKKPWYEHTEADLDALHEKWFSQVVGKIEVTEMDDLKTAFREAAKRLREAEMGREKITDGEIKWMKARYLKCEAELNRCTTLLQADRSQLNDYMFQRAHADWAEAKHRYDVVDKRFKSCKWTDGLADRAYVAWGMVRMMGLREAKGTIPERTFRRYEQIFKEAGLSLADLHAGRVLEFRRRSIELAAPVRSWDDIRRAA
jgi:hypothetical protein